MTGRGRGLFATKPIKAGAFISCEKAMATALDTDPDNEHGPLLNLETERRYDGSHILLVRELVHKLLYSPQQASRFFDLHTDGYPPGAPPVVDGVVAVDTFRVNSIIYQKAFACAETRSADVQRAASLDHTDENCSGLQKRSHAWGDQDDDAQRPALV